MDDGDVTSFLECERVLRAKNVGLGSIEALTRTLDVLGVGAVDAVGVADRTFWRQHRGWLLPALKRCFGDVPVNAWHHHDCHAFAALTASPFSRATCVTIDGKGDGLSASVVLADRAGGRKRLLEVPSASSLGRLWWGVSEFCGLAGHHSAGKVMALAAYGEALEPWAGHIELLDDGGFRFDDREVPAGTFSTAPAIARWLETVTGVRAGALHADLAAGLQGLTERVVCHLVGQAVQTTGERRVCLAGGVALNGLANQRLLSEGRCDALYVPPCTDDRGLSLGAAALATLEAGVRLTHRETPLSAFLGPESRTEGPGGGWRAVGGEPTDAVARLLARGELVAVCRGRSEAGPRALGHRSLLASPTGPEMRDRLNLEVKQREPFRPFGCAVPLEQVSQWFDLEGDSPYMLRIAKARASVSGQIPAVLHEDGTSRIQTVTEDDGSHLGMLLAALGRLGHPPIVLNTSLNRRGEPLVRTSAEAAQAALAMGVRFLLTDVGLFEVAA